MKKHILVLTYRVLLLVLTNAVFFKSHAQNECQASTLDEFYACYGGEDSFSTLYKDALNTFIATEDAIQAENYEAAKALLDELWNKYPIGNSVWNEGYENQFETNIGSPYGYCGLRMMNDIVDFKLENPHDNPDAVIANMKIVLVGCSEGIQPRTQVELDNGTGVFEERSLDASLRGEDYRIIRQSIDLFVKYSEAIANGELKVAVEFIEIPDLCLETSVDELSQGVYLARPDISPALDEVDQQTFNETDWWMVISPSAVPIGADFEDDEFITGGMGADSKGGPLFIADDAWLIRKPYHLGDGDYSDIERRAYLPQWYQHEFYHHLYRIYPEFALEVNGHDWFDRSFWPDDFEGLYEPDYYAETLYKRLQLACDPLNERLITKASEMDLALFDNIQLEDMLGAYSLDNIGNSYHEGEIIQNGNTLYWLNAAGVQWELIPRLDEGYLETGPDCPYPGSDHFIELATNELGELISVNKGFLFNGAFYRRRFNSFFQDIPIELALGEYSGAIGFSTGLLYEESQLFYWQDEDGNTVQLLPNYDQGYLDIADSEGEGLELIVVDAECNGEIILGLRGTDDVYVLDKVDQENQSPQLLDSFENLEIIGRQSVSITLSEYIEDPEGDDVLYFLFYDESMVNASILSSELEIQPISEGLSTVIVVGVDSNRGVVTAEFDMNVTDIPLVIDQEFQPKIYPNPTNGILHIEGLKEGNTFNIYNLSGAKAQSGILNNNIDVSGLKSGIYILMINNAQQGFKFTLEK